MPRYWLMKSEPSEVSIDDLAKTTITAPIDGTVTKLKSQLGERVLGLPREPR